MTTETVRRPKPARRVADRVARQLALEILDEHHDPGWRLPPEKLLKEELHCSRQAVRSALRLLEAWGLLTVKMGREGGPVTRRPEPADLVDQLAVHVQAEGATMRDVYAARRAIEPVLAQAAAANATDEQIAELGVLLDRMTNARDTAYEEYQLDAMRFNRLLGEAAGLMLLAYFLDALTLVTNNWIMPKLPFDSGRRSHLAPNSQKVLDAIRNRDPEGARRASLENRERNEEYWRSRLPDLADLPIISFEGQPLDPRALLPRAAG